MKTATLVGWIFLILSWIIPQFIEDRNKKSLIGVILSALALGIFIGHLLS